MVGCGSVRSMYLPALSLLDWSTGCDPVFCVVWFRFRLLRRYLAPWPAEGRRVYRLLDTVGEGCPGHGPIHLLSASAAVVGFRWDPDALAWSRPGLPLLSNLAGPVQQKAAVLDAWRNKVAADLCGREGVFGAGLCWMFMAPCSSLTLLMFEKEMRLCFVASWLGVSGMVCFLDGIEASLFHVGFVGLLIMMVICSGNVPFPPLVEIRENPEFHDLMRMDQAHWPRCLLWHGWLPMLSGVNGSSPWAADASESASYLVETALGQYSSRFFSEWSLPNGFDADEVSSRMPDSQEVWSDGSMVLDSVTGISAAGAGMIAHYSEFCWRDRRWGHVDCVHSVGVAHSCRAFVSVPGPLQTVQRAELWAVILAFQSADAVHIGVDNLGVVRHVGRLLDDCSFSAPLELVTDGDLLILLRWMIDLRGSSTVRVTKVMGRADEGMVSDGRVRELDWLGDNAADEATDFCRRRVGPAVIDARRNLSGVCGRWYPVILDLHRFLLLFLELLLIMMGLVCWCSS